MKNLTVILVSGLLLFAAHARAEDKPGPCDSFARACKTDADVTSQTGKSAHKKAMRICIRKAAKADHVNGQQCLAWIESHHDRAMHDGGDTEKQ